MSERGRIIIVFLVVATFIFLNQRLFKLGTDAVVIISLLTALIVYSALVLVFKRNQKS